MQRPRLHPYLLALLAGVLPLVLAAVIVLLLPRAAPELAQPAEAASDSPINNKLNTQEAESVDSPPKAAKQTAATLALESEVKDAKFDLAQQGLMALFEQLGDRARAGDPVAACELAHLVAECRMHQVTYGRGRNSPPATATSAEVERFIEREAIRQEETARMAQRCEGMNRTHEAEGALFIARAGLAGHANSLVSFTQLPQYAAADFISSPELIALYRNQLWPALRRAFISDHPQVAISILMQLAGPIDSPVAGVVPDAFRDRDVARAVLGLMSQGEWDLLSFLPPGPPPSAEITKRAEMWVDELFGGQLPDLASASQAPWRQAQAENASTCAEPEAWLDGH